MSKNNLFLIHGFGTGAWIWEDYKPRLENAGYACVTPNLPFHGVLQNPPNQEIAKLGLADYANFLEQEIKKLSSPPIIIAHSAGTLLAQILAARGVASAVVLLCPVPPVGITFVTANIDKAIGSVLRTWGFWRKPVRPTFDELVYSAMHLCCDEEQHRVYGQFSHESGRAYREIMLSALSPWSPIRIDERKVKCPMLVIGGAEDRMTPPFIAKRIAAKYDADYVELPNHAHWPFGEPKWQDFLEAIEIWIAEIE